MDSTPANGVEPQMNSNQPEAKANPRQSAKSIRNRSAAEYAKKMRRRKAHRAKIRRSHANG